MKRIWIAGITAALLAMFVLAGCNRNAQHADVKDAVDSAMTQNNLGVVKVSQDRDKGILTLTGDVINADDKTRAETIAKGVAGDYTIANELGVRPRATRARLRPSTPTSMTVSRTTTRPRSKPTKPSTIKASRRKPRTALSS